MKNRLLGHQTIVRLLSSTAMVVETGIRELYEAIDAKNRLYRLLNVHGSLKLSSGSCAAGYGYFSYYDNFSNSMASCAMGDSCVTEPVRKNFNYLNSQYGSRAECSDAKDLKSSADILLDSRNNSENSYISETEATNENRGNAMKTIIEMIKKGGKALGNLLPKAFIYISTRTLLSKDYSSEMFESRAELESEWVYIATEHMNYINGLKFSISRPIDAYGLSRLYSRPKRKEVLHG